MGKTTITHKDKEFNVHIPSGTTELNIPLRDEDGICMYKFKLINKEWVFVERISLSK